MPDICDNRFSTYPVDGRFAVAGQDWRFATPAIDARFPTPGVDRRWEGSEWAFPDEWWGSSFVVVDATDLLGAEVYGGFSDASAGGFIPSEETFKTKEGHVEPLYVLSAQGGASSVVADADAFTDGLPVGMRLQVGENEVTVPLEFSHSTNGYVTWTFDNTWDWSELVGQEGRLLFIYE